MIDVKQLCKDYGSRRAVDDVTFHVDRGEILGFLGPNGAGKTTTMRMLTGYMPPTGGTVTIAGFDIFRESRQARAEIGYLPESVPLYPEMTIRGYLDFVAKIKSMPSARRRDEIERVMGATSIDERADMLIGKLSKGFRQRVGLAQALLGSPKVLVLDEPTSGLDPNQIQEVRDLIRGLAGDHTVILSTHILPEVEMICSRVLIIDGGKLVANDTPANLTRQLRGGESVRVEVRGSRDAVAKLLRDIKRVTSVSSNLGRGEGVYVHNVVCEMGADLRDEIARAVVGAGHGLLELRQAGLSLEDIFVRLTTHESAEEAA
jgi:ABC-2 type transport system ATP-binding protein